MTEPSFPFQGTQVADAPMVEELETRGNRRTVLILAVIGVLVVGALGYFFVFSGGEDPTEAATPTRPPATQVSPEPAATPAPVKAPKLSKKAVGKDPFEALVVPAVLGTGTDPAATGEGTAAGSSTTGGVPAAAAPAPAGGGSTTSGTSAGTSTRPLTVRVISVASDNSSGRVNVGTKTYSVAVGDVFGTYFKTLRLKNGKCGSFQYGDERFDLCEGETAKMQ